jgi:hypothetical protein
MNAGGSDSSSTLLVALATGVLELQRAAHNAYQDRLSVLGRSS